MKPEAKRRIDHTAWIGIVLSLATLIVFSATLRNGFINYDDPDYVTNNAQVQKGLSWQGVKWAFCNTEDTGNWHPVTWLSHMLDYQLFSAKPFGHHLTSVLLHSANVLLLFLLLTRMTGEKWPSLVVAALFGLHPLRVESVAWVAERKDLLCAVFGLLTVWAYVLFVEATRPRAERRKEIGWYVLALVLFALGLMSKPMLVTLPFVLLLLDYWPLGRVKCRVTGAESEREGQGPGVGLRHLLLEKVPFIALAIGDAIITTVGQMGVGATDRTPELGARLSNALVSYARYLGKLFWPAGLSVHYPYPKEWPLVWIAFAAALVAGLSLLALLTRNRYPYLLMGWFWYLGMLVPVIGVLQVGIQSMADRYTYLPSIGILIMVVWSVNELVRKKASRAFTNRLLRIAFGSTMGLAGLLCVLATCRQIGYWRNSGTLFEHALAETRDNNVALMHLANYRREQGRLPEAIQLYRQAMEVDPRMEEPQVNLGVLLYVSGEQEQGIRQLEEAIKLFPNSVLLHGNLGFFLSAKGRFEEASRHLETVIKLKPDSAKAHVALGDICLKKGLREDAFAHYRQALRAQPGYAPAERRLGIAEIAPRADGLRQ